MKKIKLLNIDLIFIIYMIIAMILTIINEIDFTECKEVFAIMPMSQIVIGSILSIFICFIITIFKNIYVVVIYIGIKIGYKFYKKERLSKNDFSKSKEYYREILQGYSPAVLAFIDNFEIEYPSTIIASLLQLRKNNVIVMEEGKIKKVKDQLENSKFESNEKYIFDQIIDNKIRINKTIFKEKILKDALDLGLIEKLETVKRDKKKNIIKAFLIDFAMFAILIFSQIISSWLGIIGIIIFFLIIISLLVVMFYPIILIVSYIVYMIKSVNCPYVRTKKGEEFNKKLEGLKMYLKDYSDLADREENEVVIWEEYLVYSVLFNQNTTIIQKYEQNIELE